jgi:hypothetical protein
MANGDGFNSDKPPAAPAIQSNQSDNFGDLRLQNVQYVNTTGMPSCQDITIVGQQLRLDGPDLLDRMNTFIGGTLAQRGLSFNQIQQMAASDQFSPRDKIAFGVMESVFGRATNTKVADPHMTMRQLVNYLNAVAEQEQCRLPGQ